MSKTREERALALAREILRVPIGFAATSDEVRCILIRLADAEAHLETTNRELDAVDLALPSWKFTGRGRIETIKALTAERDELRARVAKLEEQLAFFMNEVGERRLEEILRTNSDTTPDLAAKVAALEERVARICRQVGVL